MANRERETIVLRILGALIDAWRKRREAKKAEADKG
jgi:hypothetical protein